MSRKSEEAPKTTKGFASGRYVEPRPFDDGGIFKPSDLVELPVEFQPVRERFIEECQKDQSPVGKALLSKGDAVFRGFADIWFSYEANRRTAELSDRSSCKAKFSVLRKQAQTLQSTIKDEHPIFQRYLRSGLNYNNRRKNIAPSNESYENLCVMLEEIIRVSDREIAIVYQHGAVSNDVLPRCCRSLQKFILSFGDKTVPQSLELIDRLEFESRSVHLLYRLMWCIDPAVTPSQVQTALRKLAPMRRRKRKGD